MTEQRPLQPRDGVASRLLSQDWLIWLVLLLPAFGFGWSYLQHGESFGFMREAGEWAMRILILSLMLTPLTLVFPKSKEMRALLHQRRHIGLAAFFYAVLHLWLVITEYGGVKLLAGPHLNGAILTGWLGMVLMFILAVTSNQWSLLHLGLWWKQVQRLAYVAVIAAAIHWLLMEKHWGVIFFHLAPLAMLEAYRVWWHMRARSRRAHSKK